MLMSIYRYSTSKQSGDQWTRRITLRVCTGMLVHCKQIVRGRVATRGGGWVGAPLDVENLSGHPMLMSIAETSFAASIAHCSARPASPVL